jgi:2-C-methyl-D-erythritol 4-phosphate cytidylyltransferase
MSVAALVLAAGRGARFRESATPASTAAPPKPFAQLHGCSLLGRSIRAMAEAGEIGPVLAVLPADWLERWSDVQTELGSIAGLLDPVAGGAERQDSVRAGLAALPGDVSHVAVHDAARPLVRPADVDRVVRAALAHGAALLATRATDTIHLAKATVIESSPARDECYVAQTPQVFRVDWLCEALRKAEADGVVGTDDATLVARLGIAVEIVESDAPNPKITRATDLAAAEAILAGSCA